jgi:hypothetical protein
MAKVDTPIVTPTDKDMNGAGDYFDSIGMHGSAEQARSGKGFKATIPIIR